MTNDEIREAIKVTKKIGLDGEDEQSNLGEDFKRALRTLLHCAEESLRLCKLAAMKEKNEVSREAIKEAISGSNLAFYAENKEWVDELYDALLELINGKEA